MAAAGLGVAETANHIPQIFLRQVSQGFLIEREFLCLVFHDERSLVQVYSSFKQTQRLAQACFKNGN